MTVDLYTREGCNSCERVKNRLNFYNIPYREHKIDVDLTTDELKDLFPGAKKLPILEEESGLAHSGLVEIEKMLNEYKGDTGKELLTEDRNDVGRFVNEGGYDQLRNDDESI